MGRVARRSAEDPLPSFDAPWRTPLVRPTFVVALTFVLVVFFGAGRGGSVPVPFEDATRFEADEVTSPGYTSRRQGVKGNPASWRRRDRLALAATPLSAALVADSVPVAVEPIDVRPDDSHRSGCIGRTVALPARAVDARVDRHARGVVRVAVVSVRFDRRGLRRCCCRQFWTLPDDENAGGFWPHLRG